MFHILLTLWRTYGSMECMYLCMSSVGVLDKLKYGCRAIIWNIKFLNAQQAKWAHLVPWWWWEHWSKHVDIRHIIWRKCCAECWKFLAWQQQQQQQQEQQFNIGNKINDKCWFTESLNNALYQWVSVRVNQFSQDLLAQQPPY